MKGDVILKHEFVEYIPEKLENGIVYVSIAFATVAHKCCCGCGREVNTPLSPTDWRLLFDGQSVSLDPSIGNWSFPCQSHYWIENNRVRWAPRWSHKQIAAGRAYNSLAKQEYFGNTNLTNAKLPKAPFAHSEKAGSKQSLWRKLKKWWS